MAVQGVQPFQMFIMVVFLAALVTIWLIVKQYSGRIRNKLHADRRIEVMQEMSLGTHESLRIIRVDRQEFILHAGKNTPASLHPINSELVAQSHPQQTGIETILSPSNRQGPAQEEDIPAFLLKKKMRGR